MLQRRSAAVASREADKTAQVPVSTSVRGGAPLHESLLPGLARAVEVRLEVRGQGARVLARVDFAAGANGCPKHHEVRLREGAGRAGRHSCGGGAEREA